MGSDLVFLAGTLAPATPAGEGGLPRPLPMSCELSEGGQDLGWVHDGKTMVVLSL